MSMILSQITIGDHRLIITDSDPSVGMGLAAEVGSLAVIQGQGGIYLKVTSSNDGWVLSTLDVPALLNRLGGIDSTISQETANRISDVNDEENARINADNALQSNINAEESARIAADQLLDGRLDTLEGDETVAGSVAKAKADAQAYADQKIADLVNSAPDLLNTLKELADALGNDENFATTVTNTIAAEQTRAEGVEQGLRSDLDQEISDRQTADETLQSNIDSEAAAREAADEALDGRLDPIEERATYEKYTILDNNLQVIADGQPPVRDSQLREGWYYQNLAAGQKINWYFYDGVNQANVSLGDFSAYAVMTFGSSASAPILAVYTVATGSGDIMPGFAHSKSVYSAMSQVPVVGKKYLVYFGQNPAIHPELPRIELSKSVSSSAGDQGASERVLTSSFGSNSSASVGNVKFLVEKLGIHSPAYNADVDLKFRVVDVKAYDTKVAQLNSTDASLQSQINALSGSGAGSVSDLIAQAVAAEADLREQADADLDSRLDALESDSVTKTYVDNKVSDLVNAAPAVLDTLKELADAINDDPNFATTIAGQVGQVQTNLTQEIADRQQAISEEATARENADDAISQDLADEVTRALAKEAEIESGIQSIASTLMGEIDFRTSGDEALQQAIDDEETRALAAEQNLQNAINDEATARSNEDLTLVKLDGSRAMTGDLDMGSNDVKSVDKLGLGSASPETKFHLEENGVKYNISGHSVSTTGAETQVLASVSPETDSVEMLKVIIAGIESSTKASVLYERTVHAMNIGGTVAVSTVQSDYTSEDSSLTSADCSFDVSGSNVNINVLGVITKDISWKAILHRMRNVSTGGAGGGGSGSGGGSDSLSWNSFSIMSVGGMANVSAVLFNNGVMDTNPARLVNVRVYSDIARTNLVNTWPLSSVTGMVNFPMPTGLLTGGQTYYVTIEVSGITSDTSFVAPIPPPMFRPIPPTSASVGGVEGTIVISWGGANLSGYYVGLVPASGGMMDPATVVIGDAALMTGIIQASDVVSGESYKVVLYSDAQCTIGANAMTNNFVIP